MHAIIYKTLFTLLSMTLLHGSSVLAAPVAKSHHSHSHHSHKSTRSNSKPKHNSNLSKNAISADSRPETFIAKAPHWVTYSDSDPGTSRVVPQATQLAGFNVFILAFYLSSGPSDQLANFVNLPASEKKEIIDDLHSHGISLMMSVFGSTEKPTTDGVDPESFASQVATFVKNNGLDGVDVDYEDFDAINSGKGKAESWLVSFTKALRSHLPHDQYIITHAPVSPWFTTDKSAYPHGAYRTVHQQAGSDIDWYNLQYYNQGKAYTSCDQIVTKSPSSFPHTSLKEINKYTDVPLSKLVIGKPAKASDSDDGHFMSSGEIASCVQQAKKELGWNAGTMFWEYPHASMNLISTVRSLSFPLQLGL